VDRRQFLHRGLGATFVSPLLSDLAFAQPQTPAPPAARPAVLSPRKLVLDVYTKQLQWMRSADDVAQAAIEMVVHGVCPTVEAYPGHIDPAKVTQELPAFVNRIRGHGLRVTQFKGPDVSEITAANAVNVEAMVGAAAQAGLTHYQLGGYTYDLSKPLNPQLDAIKLRVDKFVRLNQKHGMTLVFNTASGPTAVGANVLDLLSVLKNFDPRYVGFHWDTGHMALHGDTMWEPLLRLAAPYVLAIGWRDRGWKQDLGLLGEGGPYMGPYPRVEPLVTQPDGSAIPGTPAPAGAAAGGRGGGRGRAGGPGPDPNAAPAGARGVGNPDDGGPPAPAGRGPARGPANSAGAGSIDDTNPLFKSKDGEMPKRPIGGKNAKGAGWSAPDTPMGTGALHIPHFAAVLREIGFNGPSELQSEYAGMGGAESGADKIDRPRQWVIGMLKRDVLTIRKSFEMAAAGLEI
jgi:sugar phosphate isomerase/epimerase